MLKWSANLTMLFKEVPFSEKRVVCTTSDLIL
jgi:hypothetical protein